MQQADHIRRLLLDDESNAQQQGLRQVQQVDRALLAAVVTPVYELRAPPQPGGFHELFRHPGWPDTPAMLDAGLLHFAADLAAVERLQLPRSKAPPSAFAMAQLSQLTGLSLSVQGATQLPAALGAAQQLTELRLERFEELQNLGGLNRFPKLARLSLRGCSRLDLEQLWHAGGVSHLDVSGCSWFRVHKALQQHLVSLHADGCGQLADTRWLQWLPKLRGLSLREVPISRPLRHPELRVLTVSTPAAIFRAQLPQLLRLRVEESDVAGAAVREPLVTPLMALRSLRRLELRLWYTIEDLAVLRGLPQLEELRIEQGVPAKLLLRQWPALRSLEVSSYGRNAHFAKSFELAIQQCPQLARLQFLDTVYLTGISIDGCPALGDVTGLAHAQRLARVAVERCPQLRRLELEACPSLASLVLRQLGGLTELVLQHSRQLGAIELSGAGRLASVDVDECGALSTLDWLRNAAHLRELSARGCLRLVDIGALGEMAWLTALDLSGCSSLASVAALSQLPQLRSIKLADCSGLPHVDPLAELPQLQHLDIRRCGFSVRDHVALSGIELLDGYASARDQWALFAAAAPSPPREEAERIVISALCSDAYRWLASVVLSPDEALRALDERLFRQLDVIMAHPRLRGLERHWRELYGLVEQAHSHRNQQTWIFNCSYEDMLFDIEDSPELRKCGVWKLVHASELGSFGGRPYRMLLWSEPLSLSPQDMTVLQACAESARATGGVLVATVAAQAFGWRSWHDADAADTVERAQQSPAMQAFQQWRQHPASRFTALVASELQLRPSYRDSGDFPDSAGPLYGSGARMLAQRFLHSFRATGSGIGLCGPLPETPSDAAAVHPPALRAALARAGLLSLGRDGDMAAIDHAPSCYRPPPNSPAYELPDVLLCGRAIETLKVIAREQIWCFRDGPGVMQKLLQPWLDQYCAVGPTHHRGRLFRQARLEHRERVAGSEVYTLRIQAQTERPDGDPELTFEVELELE